ncbi:hypothetical protein QWZ14_29275, partial [Paeniroseomonas aquatica]
VAASYTTQWGTTHTSIETTTRAYAGTESAAAVRHYDKTLERLRAQPVAPQRGRGRGRGR